MTNYATRFVNCDSNPHTHLNKKSNNAPANHQPSTPLQLTKTTRDHPNSAKIERRKDATEPYT